MYVGRQRRQTLQQRHRKLVLISNEHLRQPELDLWVMTNACQECDVAASVTETRYFSECTCQAQSLDYSTNQPTGMPHHGSLVHVDQQRRAMGRSGCAGCVDPLEISQSLARNTQPKTGAPDTPKNGFAIGLYLEMLLFPGYAPNFGFPKHNQKRACPRCSLDCFSCTDRWLHSLSFPMRNPQRNRNVANHLLWLRGVVSRSERNFCW